MKSELSDQQPANDDGSHENHPASAGAASCGPPLAAAAAGSAGLFTPAAALAAATAAGGKAAPATARARFRPKGWPSTPRAGRTGS